MTDVSKVKRGPTIQVDAAAVVVALGQRGGLMGERGPLRRRGRARAKPVL